MRRQRSFLPLPPGYFPSYAHREELLSELANRFPDCTQWPAEEALAEQLLIESAGGRVVPELADQPDLRLCLGIPGEDRPAEGLFFAPDGGPAALERLLHWRILPQTSRYRPS